MRRGNFAAPEAIALLNRARLAGPCPGDGGLKTGGPLAELIAF